MRLKPTDGVLSRYPNIRDCSSIGARLTLVSLTGIVRIAVEEKTKM